MVDASKVHFDSDAPICNDAAALAGYIAQQSEILKRTDLTPCRRAHHEKKLASYREMLQGFGCGGIIAIQESTE